MTSFRLLWGSRNILRADSHERRSKSIYALPFGDLTSPNLAIHPCLQVLGVEKGASINQITKAYRILALRYHPDRNLKDAPTGEKFKEISTAYAILSDPNKRRRYDLSGGDTSEMFDDSTESLDLENLNSLQKVVFAIITRFGPNFQTQVNAETLIKAKDLCNDVRAKNRGKEKGKREEGQRVVNLKPGFSMVGKTVAQRGNFYRLQLSEADAANGVIVSCCSSSQDRFKLICFEADGSVRYMQESSPHHEKKDTVADLLLVPFQTITSYGTSENYEIKKTDPLLFSRLNILTLEARSIQAGEHLLCVYGDNWYTGSSYTITIMRAHLDPLLVQTMREMDDKLYAKKGEIERLKEQYDRAEAAFEAIKAKVDEESKVTEALVQEREAAYSRFITSSVRNYGPHLSAGLKGPPTSSTAQAAPSLPLAQGSHMEALSASTSGGLPVGVSETNKDSKEVVSPAARASADLGEGKNCKSAPGAGVTRAAERSGNSDKSISGTSPTKRSSFSFLAGFRRGGRGGSIVQQEELQASKA